MRASVERKLREQREQQEKFENVLGMLLAFLAGVGLALPFMLYFWIY